MPDFIDVLPLLKAASSALRHGELIQSPALTLFEATSAIEIGEPRMDAGTSIAEELAFPAFNVHRALLPHELIWVMDTLLSYEMRWHEGLSLAQTVFTCMYVLRVDEMQDEEAVLEDAATNGKAPYPVELVTLVLRAYVRATLKTCDVMMEEMLKRHLYDNEDFSSDKAGVSLLEDVEIDTIVEELNEAQDWLAAWQSDWSEQYGVPLSVRLRARADLLLAVCLFFDESIPLGAISQHIANVKESAAFLKRLDTNLPPDGDVPGVFSPFAAKKLESLTPPRPPVESLTKSKTWSALRLLCNGIESAISLAEAEDWCDIESHMSQMADHKLPVWPYIRSIHQSIFFANQKICTRFRLYWLGETFLELHTGKSYVGAISKDVNLLPRCEKIMERLSRALADNIANLGKNKARQYRKLGRSLEEWQELEDRLLRLEGDVVSARDPFPARELLSAIGAMKARIATRVVLLGAELELYAPGELKSLFWYLCMTTEAAVKSLVELGRVTTYVEDCLEDIKTLQTLSHASLLMLVLSEAKAATVGKRTDFVAFQQRFKWTRESGVLYATHEEYSARLSQLRGLASDQLRQEAKNMLSTLAAAEPPFQPEKYRTTVELNLSALTGEGQLQLGASETWPTPHFPVFSSS